MNSGQKSTQLLYFLYVVFLIMPLGCQPKSKVQSISAVQPEEISLKADREHLDKIRKDIPSEKRQANDELLVIIKDMAGERNPPSKVRSRFDREVRKVRSQFNKKIRMAREEFKRLERERRAEFLADHKLKRKKYLSKKHSKEERSDFFNRHESTRRNFFNNERERRQEFESEIRQKRADFDDYLREKRKIFNDEYRSYVIDYRRRIEIEKNKKRFQGRPNSGANNHWSDIYTDMQKEFLRKPKERETLSTDE